MKKEKVGLVLSGGGMRGMAHIGALKVFEQEGITFDAVAGCSAGSIIGAFYAAGKTPEEMERFFLGTRVYKFFDLSLSTVGINRTVNLQKAIENFTGVKIFEDLKIPLYINATNVSQAGEEQVFSKGPLFEAIRASIAFPGVIAPHKIKDDYFIDGGVVNQVPFSLLPNTIKKYVIVNVTPVGKLTEKKDLTLIKILEASVKMMENQIISLRLQTLHRDQYVLIEPELSSYKVITSEKYFADIIQRGEDAAEKKMGEIKKRILS